MEFIRFLVSCVVASYCVAAPTFFCFVAQNYSAPMSYVLLTFIAGTWFLTFVTLVCAINNFLDGP